MIYAAAVIIIALMIDLTTIFIDCIRWIFKESDSLSLWYLSPIFFMPKYAYTIHVRSKASKKVTVESNGEKKLGKLNCTWLKKIQETL